MLTPIINSVVYSALGVVLLCGAFWLIDRITPGKLWEELLEKQNTAIAIVAAGAAIAIGLIVASAIH